MIENTHNFILDVLTLKPEQFLENEKDKIKLQEFSKEELIEISLISVDIIRKINVERHQLKEEIEKLHKEKSK